MRVKMLTKAAGSFSAAIGQEIDVSDDLGYQLCDGGSAIPVLLTEETDEEETELLRQSAPIIDHDKESPVDEQKEKQDKESPVDEQKEKQDKESPPGKPTPKRRGKKK